MATIDQLTALGFEIVGGNIDKGGVNYGTNTPDGPVLTPEGEDLVATLTKKRRKATPDDIAAAVADAVANQSA
jgi:hypothetical protein